MEQLNYNDIQYIITEASKILLNEINVKDAYHQYYSHIPIDVYASIVSASQFGNDILLPETKWLLSRYKVQPDVVVNFLPYLRKDNKKGYFDKFERAKVRGLLQGEKSNINKLSVEEFMDLIDSLDEDELFSRTKGEWSKATNDAKNDIDVLYEDEEWFVLIPHSMEASCYWGNGASWCTAARNEKSNYFSRYNDKGPLIININKVTKEKYQFHLHSHEFKNKDNEDIDKPVLEGMGASKGLMEFYNQYLENDKTNRLLLFEINLSDDDYVWIEKYEMQVASVKMDGKYNFFDGQDFLSEEWFDNVGYINENYGTCEVWIDGKRNIFNMNSGLVYDEGFDYIGNWCSFDLYLGDDEEYEVAEVRKDNRWNFISRSGSLLHYGQWFKWVEGFDGSHEWTAVQDNDDEYNWLNIWGEIVCDIWFDEIWESNGSIVKVEKKGKYNYVDLSEEGELLSNTWFDWCDDTLDHGEEANVIIGGVTYRIDGYGDFYNEEGDKIDVDF